MYETILALKQAVEQLLGQRAQTVNRGSGSGVRSNENPVTSVQDMRAALEKRLEATDNAVIEKFISDGAVTKAKLAGGITPLEIVDVLPSTDNYEGRHVYLTTDDRIYLWDGAAWGFNIVQATTSQVGVVELATTTELRSAAANVVVTPETTLNAMAWVALADDTTIGVDHAAGVNRVVTLGGNRTMGNPTNVKVGWPLNLRIGQDGTGSRTVTWGSNYDFGDEDPPDLSEDPNKEDLVTFIAISATKFAYLGIRREIE